MRKIDCIEQTKNYIRNQFLKSDIFETAHEALYRLEHSYRVANIGEEIAKAEGLDIEVLVVACLLHDISYCFPFTDNNYLNHGRDSAKLVRPFLDQLGFSKNEINEICFGIAIHVDDVSDFEGIRSPLALSVGDADNIDRFDVYRIYDTLENLCFSEMPIEEKIQHIDKVLLRLPILREEKLGTKKAEELWIEKIDFQILFYRKLKDQLSKSN